MVSPKIAATTAKRADARKKAIKTTQPSTTAWVAATKDAGHATTIPPEIKGALQKLELAKIN